MLVQLARDLGELDKDLSIKINVVDNIYTMEVVCDDLGSLYLFSSTSLCEVYNKILDFKECLEDVDKFSELLKEIEEEPLEV